MKILILSTFERNGGAAIAANRLMHALNKAGHEAKMLVRDKQTDDENVVSINTNWLKKKLNFLRFAYERWVIFVHNGFNRKELFTVSIANTGTNISKHPLVQAADVIHLHWINQGFLSLKNIQQLIQTNKPIVWTMHDMWHSTGICHYVANSGTMPHIAAVPPIDYSCNSYKTECGECPLLKSSIKHDLSHKTWRRKRFFAKDIRFIAVSTWLQEQAHKSPLLKTANIEVIPNVIDINVFKSSDKFSVRKELSLPIDKKIILMGAAQLNNPLKGFSYLQKALRCLTSTENNYLLVLFGKIKDAPDFFNALPISHIHLGEIADIVQIAKLYQAADVTVVPSLYETFGQTISEAMACGCPAVSFDNSGQTDIIVHKKTGYLAKYKDAEDLAKGILFCLENNAELSANAREKILKTYAEDVVAQQYLNLYNGK